MSRDHEQSLSVLIVPEVSDDGGEYWPKRGLGTPCRGTMNDVHVPSSVGIGMASLTRFQDLQVKRDGSSSSARRRLVDRIAVSRGPNEFYCYDVRPTTGRIGRTRSSIPRVTGKGGRTHWRVRALYEFLNQR